MVSPQRCIPASNPILTQFNPEQPMDAGIVYVQHDHMVNDRDGSRWQDAGRVPSVPLLAGHYVADEDTDVYCCCEWMCPTSRVSGSQDRGGRQARSCLNRSTASPPSASNWSTPGVWRSLCLGDCQVRAAGCRWNQCGARHAASVAHAFQSAHRNATRSTRRGQRPAGCPVREAGRTAKSAAMASGIS